MRTDDIEAGNLPSLGEPVAPEDAPTADKVDYSHIDLDTTDLEEASSESSTASFRTSRADLDIGTVRNAYHPVKQYPPDCLLLLSSS